MSHRIVAISVRPDPGCPVDAFFDTPNDSPVEDMTARILAPPQGRKEAVILFDNDKPAGTAGMVRTDLKSRPNITALVGSRLADPVMMGEGPPSSSCGAWIKKDVDSGPSPTMTMTGRRAARSDAVIVGRRLKSRPDLTPWLATGRDGAGGGHDVTLMRRDLSGSGQ